MRGIAFACLMVFAGCMAPEAEAPSPDEAVARALAKETAKAERQSVLGGLFADKAEEDGASDPIQPLSQLAGTLEPQDERTKTALVAASADGSGSGGIFGFLRPGASSEDETRERVEPAALKSAPPQSAGPPRFGSISTVCKARRSRMGKEVGAWPEKGKKAFRLYDSDPDSIAVRDFFVTGFRDGCARQLRASIAFFGAPSTHETVRYDPLNRDIPQSPTDKAYEKIKRRVCGVPTGKPCGERKIGRLEATTVFVTAYDDFGSSTRWAEFLLSGGRFEGVSLKSR